MVTAIHREVAIVPTTSALSLAARQRILSRRGEPLFLADWERVLMIHFEVNADELQRDLPFQLDLRNGRAFVSLVLFTMRGMKPRFGGALAAWLFRPISSHDFLNVRTYVRHGNEIGIHFLTEWLSNRYAVRIGPATFGLPYRFGRMDYHQEWWNEDLRGCVTDAATGATLSYRAKFRARTDFRPCEAGSLTEWLMERYTAFNCAGGRQRFFRVWHAPWPQSPIEVTLLNDSLLTSTWPWFERVRIIGANYSPGVRDVWMGRPQRITAHSCKMVSPSRKLTP